MPPTASAPTIVAHRGLHTDWPENSLKALLAAWEAGIEWCECDVRGSREHEPFLLHDESLERTTDGAGLIQQTPSAALPSFNLRRTDGTIAPTCVPRLKTVINAIPPNAKLLIEIKPRVSDDTVRQTLELCDPASCVIQSFDRSILRVAESHRPEIRRMLLVDDAAHPAALEPGPWEGINARHDTLAPPIVEAIRREGFSVGAWTPNEQSDLRRSIGLRVDFLITDRPLRALSFLGALDRLRQRPRDSDEQIG